MTVGWKQPCDSVCACPPWFVQNIIASDCLCFYWIRLSLLTPTAINKQAMAALPETVWLLSQFQRRFVLCTHTVWCIYSILGMDFSICVIHGNDAPHYKNHFWSLVDFLWSFNHQSLNETLTEESAAVLWGLCWICVISKRKSWVEVTFNSHLYW